LLHHRGSMEPLHPKSNRTEQPLCGTDPRPLCGFGFILGGPEAETLGPPQMPSDDFTRRRADMQGDAPP
jgi:hypothetical protein